VILPPFSTKLVGRPGFPAIPVVNGQPLLRAVTAFVRVSKVSCCEFALQPMAYEYFGTVGHAAFFFGSGLLPWQMGSGTCVMVSLQLNISTSLIDADNVENSIWGPVGF